MKDDLKCTDCKKRPAEWIVTMGSGDCHGEVGMSLCDPCSTKNGREGILRKKWQVVTSTAGKERWQSFRLDPDAEVEQMRDNAWVKVRRLFCIETIKEFEGELHRVSDGTSSLATWHPIVEHEWLTRANELMKEDIEKTLATKKTIVEKAL